MAEAAGFRVHVYTSPQLVRFHERIRVAGEAIDEAWLDVGHRTKIDFAPGLEPPALPGLLLSAAMGRKPFPDRLHQVIHHVNRFDPRMARRLILDTGTTDLAYLVKDLVV